MARPLQPVLCVTWIAVYEDAACIVLGVDTPLRRAGRRAAAAAAARQLLVVDQWGCCLDGDNATLPQVARWADVLLCVAFTQCGRLLVTTVAAPAARDLRLAVNAHTKCESGDCQKLQRLLG